MVAAQTACAVLVLPDDLALVIGGDVVLRATTHTAFALDAVLGGVEVFVGDEEAVEERVQHMGLHPRHLASHHLRFLLPILQAFSDGWKKFPRFLHLGLRHLVLIDVEAWQTDVGVGHVDREDGVGFPSQCLVQNLVRIADVIATGHHRPHIFGIFDFLLM